MKKSKKYFFHIGHLGGELYTKEKSKAVESVLKDMHKIAKKSRHVKEADLESSNTPTYDQSPDSAPLLPPEGKKTELLNSKNEFNHPPIARISVERNKKKIKQAGAELCQAQVKLG